jgi:hypothetical protein
MVNVFLSASLATLMEERDNMYTEQSFADAGCYIFVCVCVCVCIYIYIYIKRIDHHTLLDLSETKMISPAWMVLTLWHIRSCTWRTRAWLIKLASCLKGDLHTPPSPSCCAERVPCSKIYV